MTDNCLVGTSDFYHGYCCIFWLYLCHLVPTSTIQEANSLRAEKKVSVKEMYGTLEDKCNELWANKRRLSLESIKSCFPGDRSGRASCQLRLRNITTLRLSSVLSEPLWPHLTGTEINSAKSSTAIICCFWEWCPWIEISQSSFDLIHNGLLPTAVCRGKVCTTAAEH